jgi:hypothetical protein
LARIAGRVFPLPQLATFGEPMARAFSVASYASDCWNFFNLAQLIFPWHFSQKCHCITAPQMFV